MEGTETDGLCHRPDELGRPGEVGERPCRCVSLETRNPRLQEHVEPEPRDFATSQEGDEGIDRELQVPLEITRPYGSGRRLDVDDGALGFDEIDESAQSARRQASWSRSGP